MRNMNESILHWMQTGYLKLYSNNRRNPCITSVCAVCSSSETVVLWKQLWKARHWNSYYMWLCCFECSRNYSRIWLYAKMSAINICINRLHFSNRKILIDTTKKAKKKISEFSRYVRFSALIPKIYSIGP